VLGAGIACGIFGFLVAASGAKVANGDFGFLFGLGVVPVLILGGTAGAVWFGVVGMIARFGPGVPEPSPLSYAALSSLMWGVGAWLLAVNAPQERVQEGHSLLLYGLAAVAITGLLTGGAVQLGRRQPYRTSRPGANR
jgi:hypothetical protein